METPQYIRFFCPLVSLYLNDGYAKCCFRAEIQIRTAPNPAGANEGQASHKDAEAKKPYHREPPTRENAQKWQRIEFLPIPDKRAGETTCKAATGQ